MAGASWTSKLQLYDCVSLQGIPLSNNVAEVAAVIMCLSAWKGHNIVIHTDSSLVMRLVGGNLLAMERDGWGDFPWVSHSCSHQPPYRHLLFQLRSHRGRLSFSKAKAHSSDRWNNLADSLVNEGRLRGCPLDLGALHTPDGWVGLFPVLAHQPVPYLSAMTVRGLVTAPLSSRKASKFCDRWTVTMGTLFGVYLDVDRYAQLVWKINMPVGLKETL